MITYNHLSNMNGRRDRSPLRDREGMRNDRDSRGDRDRGPRRFGGDRDRDRSGPPPRDRPPAGGAGRRGRPERRVYVSNIPFDFRWQELKDLFRHEVGEVSYVEVFTDDTGKSRGCGIIEFDSNELVDIALEKMHRYDLNGRKIVVKELDAVRRQDFGVERDRYGRILRDGVPHGDIGVGGRGGHPRAGDMGRDGRRGFLGDGPPSGPAVPPEAKYTNTYGLNVSFLESLGIDGPLVNRVFVANLIYSVDEKQLKEVFGLAGKVVSVSINKDREGNSKGHGVVEFEHPVEAVQAISMLNNQMYMDRVISVRMDRVAERKDRDTGPALPPGLSGLGLGLGSNGKPLADVASKLEAQQQQMAVPAPAPAAAQLGGLGGLTNLTAANGAAALGLMGAAPGAAAAGFPVGVPMVSAAGGVGLGALGGLTSLGATGGLGQLGAASQLGQLPQPGLSQLGGGLPAAATAPAGGFGGGDDLRGMGGRGGGLDRGGDPGRSGRPSYGGGGGFGSSDYNSGSSRNFSDSIIVSNLDPGFTWQMLRDHFREAGEVRYADMKGKGVGVVRFSSPHEAQRAISLMDGSRCDGRTIDVRSY
ncbi:myelin expression factor 2-like isoform X3 [Amphibalanus amphitrite]|uniref:myelin expression factor 2-like isoform X3 n=1 Tax=Amphibalanus amphitrite TaxID=1232801 RepID=UPI001C90346B|nr:myelin expression factor 2-like isoform X3 [Amphibalanus amphitrite]